MKILLIGNYEPSGQTSMQQFSRLLEDGLRGVGHEVRVLRPRVVFGRLPVPGAIRKWFGYIDQFVIFPTRLKAAANWADLVHVCDHANSLYIKYFKHRPHALTCHDVLAIRSALGEFPHHRTRWSGRILQRLILRGLRQSKHIVCVSDTTHRELLRVAGVDPESVHRIYNGLHFPYTPLENGEARRRLEKFGIGRLQRFILHVGTNSWYKNRLGVLQIFASLRALPESDGLQLVMVGYPMTPGMRAFIREHQLVSQVREMVNVSNEDLRALYSSADLLLFPSLQEGFGWPIIEAQACGCPVVTSNRLPMTEIGGTAATYIDPERVDLAPAILAPLIGQRTEPCEESLRNAGQFNTTSMITLYDALFQTIANAGAPNLLAGAGVQNGEAHDLAAEPGVPLNTYSEKDFDPISEG